MTSIPLCGIWHATCWEWKYSFDFPLTASISACMFSSDPTLTVENVTKVMGEVENWWAIGTSLHVLHFKLKEIKYQFCAMKDKSHALGEYWIKTDPDASWENLASQLYMNGEGRAATIAKQFLPSGMHNYNWTHILWCLPTHLEKLMMFLSSCSLTSFYLFISFRPHPEHRKCGGSNGNGDKLGEDWEGAWYSTL